MARKTLLATLIAAILACPTAVAFAAADDIVKHPACKYCGMDRERWDHSRFYIEYQDGITVGTCSVHCAAIDLATNIFKFPKEIWVADYDTRRLIDAEAAVWVIGGEKPGVMTSRAKWAFADKDAAGIFVKQFEGTIGSFDDAIKSAYADMYEDTKRIRDHLTGKRKGAGLIPASP